MSDRTLKMGAILPHARLFGGVKRFFELGREFTRRGHRFTVFTPDGLSPDWFPDSCAVEKISGLKDHVLDALFITETDFLKDLTDAVAHLKIFYHVGPRAKLHQVLKHREIIVFVNSSNMYDLDRRKYGIEPVKALGGIHIPDIPRTPRNPNDPFTVMAYGRLGRKSKGTALVVKACEKLYRKGYPVKLLLFDTPVDDISMQRIKDFRCKLPHEFIIGHPVNEIGTLYSRASVFVSAEKKGGWSNTSAEAMAAGVPLIGTVTGTKDFLINNETGLLVYRHPYFIRKAIEKLINNPELANLLAQNGRKRVERFNWKTLAGSIESFVQSRL